jgi:glyoxylase-like metal-dependent hydrolase (beta-lactamase superfamily II)
MQELERGIYIENSFPGVTIGAIVLSMGTIFVDAPLRMEDARAWLLYLHSRGGNAQRMLVNLDAHPDRTLGARSMECIILAHQKTAQVFRARPSVFKGQNTESGSEWETFEDVVGTRWAIPDITFTEKISIYWGDREVIIDHHPGPSPGSIWVSIPVSRVLFVGDAVLENQPPFLTNADLPAWIDTLGVLLRNFQDYKIISGRGGLVSLDTVKAQQNHLKNIQKKVERLAKHRAAPETLESLIPGLLSDLIIPADLQEQYTQRYRHGLYQYYTRCYRSSELESPGE